MIKVDFKRAIDYVGKLDPAVKNFFFTIGAGLVTKYLGIPLIRAYSTPSNVIPFPYMTKNSTDAAITALYNNAVEMTWDSDKMKVVDDICEIVNGGLADDNTKALATRVLSDLSDEMSWSSSKRYISDKIKEIALS